MTARDRRALAAGGALAALLVLALKVAPWGWNALRSQRADLEARVELLERIRAEVRSADRLEDSGAVVKARLAALAPRLLSGRTRSEAVADLGARVTAAARRHRVRVSRKDPVIDSSRTGALQAGALRATLESDTRGLFGFLSAVSEEAAVLVVDSLRVTVSDPAVPRDRAELVRSELVIRGWYLSAKETP